MKPTPKNLEAKAILEYSEHTNLKDGTEVIVTCESFDKPIHKIGEEMKSWIHITYARKVGLRYLAYFPLPMTLNEMTDKVASIVEVIDHEDYKYSHIVEVVKKDE